MAFTALLLALASPACSASDDTTTVTPTKDAGQTGVDAGPAPFCAVNQTKCGLSCAFLAADPVNCGRCGNPCAPFPSGAARCVNGICADPACGAGFADCDLDQKNGCEVNVGGSLANDCGVCGRACGGPCVNGLCKPVSLAPGLVAPFSVVRDGTDLFLTDYGKDISMPADGRVLKVPAGGGPAVVLADLQALPRGLAVDALYVYYTLFGAKGSGQGSVMKVGRDGTCGAAPTCPIVLASSRKAPWSVALDTDYVYWTERGTSAASNSDGGVFRVKKDGSAAPEVVVFPAGEAIALALSDTEAYFSANGHVYGAPKTGGLGVDIATADGGLAVFGPTLYVGDSARVSVEPLAGGAPSFLFVKQGATAIAVDSTVLFVYENGQVYESRPSGACPFAGTCPVKVLSLLAPVDPSPSPFAFDDSYVYGASTDGRLLRVPR